MHGPETLKVIADAAHDAGAALICDEIAVNFGRAARCSPTPSQHRAGYHLPRQSADRRRDQSRRHCGDDGGVRGISVGRCRHRPDAVPPIWQPRWPVPPPMPRSTCSRPNRLQQVAAIEAQLKRELAPLTGLPGITEVRVKGAIGAVEVENLHDLDWLKGQFVDAGIWLRPFGNVIYTMPPFTITPAELSNITGAMMEIIPRWAARRRNRVHNGTTDRYRRGRRQWGVRRVSVSPAPATWARHRHAARDSRHHALDRRGRRPVCLAWILRSLTRHVLASGTRICCRLPDPEEREKGCAFAARSSTIRLWRTSRQRSTI